MHIYAYSGIFRHIQTYSDTIKHIQSYSGIIQAFCKPSAKSSIFRTLIYSESWHIQNMRYIQNPGSHLRIRDIFRILGYLEPWGIQNRRYTQNLIKHLRWSALRNLIIEKL